MRRKDHSEKSISIAKSNLNTPERASARKVMSLKQHTATLTFFKVRIIKALNEVNKLCEGNNLFLPPEIERIQIELAVTDVIDIKETAQGFICVGVEECNR